MSSDKVREQSFKRDRILHKQIIGRREEDSHPASAISTNSGNLEEVLDAKADLVDGKIPAEQLPVIPTLELGETSTTAGRGDLTKEAYDHSQSSHAPDNAQKNVQPDWNQATDTADDFIKNKPPIPSAQIQSDWNQATDTEKDYIKNKPSLPTRDSLGLGAGDSPEFANTNITNLQSDAVQGGVIPAAQVAWLGSTAKSVLSYIAKLVEKVFYLYPQTALTFTGAIDLTKVDSHYTDYNQSGALGITIAANSIIGGSADITITADGSAITVTGATQYGDTAIDYTAAKINHFLFVKWSHGIYYTVKQLN